MGISRRTFMQLSGAASLPLVLPRMVFAQAGQSTDHTLVSVFLRGGADGLYAIPPFGDPRYASLRSTLSVAPPGQNEGALDLDGFFGLHPALGALHSAFVDGDLAIVHAAGSIANTRSHFDAQDNMETGRDPGQPVFDGWINRLLQETASESGLDPALRGIGLGTNLQLSLNGAAPVFSAPSLDGFDLSVPESARPFVAATLQAQYGLDAQLGAPVADLFAAVEQINGINFFDPSESDNGYPASPFGMQLAETAAIINAGLAAEFVCLDIGSWDHHVDQANDFNSVAGQFAAGLAAFWEDVKDADRKVSVIVMTEFGRRATQNAAGGTDHGHGSFMLALGNDVAGGNVYANWPGLGPNDLNEGDLEVSTDYRAVLSEYLKYSRPGLDLANVFPHYAADQNLGIFPQTMSGR